MYAVQHYWYLLWEILYVGEAAVYTIRYIIHVPGSTFHHWHVSVRAMPSLATELLLHRVKNKRANYSDS